MMDFKLCLRSTLQCTSEVRPNVPERSPSVLPCAVLNNGPGTRGDPVSTDFDALNLWDVCAHTLDGEPAGMVSQDWLADNADAEG